MSHSPRLLALLLEQNAMGDGRSEMACMTNVQARSRRSTVVLGLGVAKVSRHTTFAVTQNRCSRWRPPKIGTRKF